MKILRLRAQEPNGALAVVEWFGELDPRRESVVDAHSAITALNERNKLIRTLILRPGAPAAAVHIHDDRQPLVGQFFGAIDTPLARDRAPHPVRHVALELDVFGHGRPQRVALCRLDALRGDLGCWIGTPGWSPSQDS